MDIASADIIGCRACGRPTFVGESRGKFLLLDAEPSSTAVAWAYVYIGAGRIAPRFAPADGRTPAYTTHWVTLCDRLSGPLYAEAVKWVGRPGT